MLAPAVGGVPAQSALALSAAADGPTALLKKRKHRGPDCAYSFKALGKVRHLLAPVCLDDLTVRLALPDSPCNLTSSSQAEKDEAARAKLEAFKQRCNQMDASLTSKATASNYYGVLAIFRGWLLQLPAEKKLQLGDECIKGLIIPQPAMTDYLADMQSLGCPPGQVKEYMKGLEWAAKVLLVPIPSSIS